MDAQNFKNQIKQAIIAFNKGNLTVNSRNLFNLLGYESDLQEDFETKNFEEFENRYFNDNTKFNKINALVDEWKYVDLIFQITENEILKQTTLFDTKKVNNTIINSYMFFVIELQNKTYTRTQLATITREINRVFMMPTMILFKYNNLLTFSVINRRLNKKDENKDVLEKVTLIKDITIPQNQNQYTNRAHIEILFDLSISELLDKHKFTNFVELHNAWQKTLDLKELNKRFFTELSNWYFYASQNVEFPDDMEKNKEIRNATNLIRFITRIIFIWFLKEKNLIPENIFDLRTLNKILKSFEPETSSVYYPAIMQNLFFGTLNQKMNERGFAKDGNLNDNKKQYGVKNLFRYAGMFNISEKEVLSLFDKIPFLNGGLFDCLDKEDENKKVQYVDGYSRNPKKQAKIPDNLFFCEKGKDVDLTDFYDPDAKKRIIKNVRGLINILDSYKFTITENTPIEEEVALDPELLGKVFENLLASYNPETKSTARKQTGSFYTPREIVDYMVNESLIAYLLETLTKFETFSNLELETKLRDLISFTYKIPSFSETQTETLINAIDNCKILDPACGSGAFPMGVLHKLVHILTKLDPDNKLWKKQQRERLIGEKIEQLINDKEVAKNISDNEVRNIATNAITERLKDIEQTFDRTYNFDDYARKLYLIENCIYGVDIQPIAVQISKLRFFISLIIHQKANSDTENNLGIRPLPNLETKFVAANTLIGLEKPKGQMNLKNLELEKFENQLKNLRHLYFNAKSRKEKLDYQQKDKDLREQISKILISDGWDKTTAQNIVSFDPYNQNQTSSFFDTEWMFGLKPIDFSENPEITLLNIQIDATNKQIDAINFGLKLKIEPIIKLQIKTVNEQIDILKNEIIYIKTRIEVFYGKINNKVKNIVSEPENYDYQINILNNKIKSINKQINELSKHLRTPIENNTGVFDIVIGNPPYISGLEASKNIDNRIRDEYKKQFTSATGTYDIYLLFFEKGLKLLKNNSFLTFITPSKYLSANYSIDFRKMIVEKYSLNKITDFSKIKVFESAAVSTLVTLFSNKKQVDEINTIFVKNLNFTDNLNYKNNKSLLTIFPENLWGMLLSENIKIIENIIKKSNYLKDFAEINACTTANEADKFEKLLQNNYEKNSLKFVNNGSIDRYESLWGKKAIKKTMLEPYLDLKKIKNDRREKMFLKPKLIFVKLSKHPEILIDINGEYASANTNMVFDVKNYDLKFLGGFFNSKLFEFLYGTLFGGLSMFGTFQFQAPQIRICLIPKISSKAQQPFINLVDTILEKKKQAENTDNEEHEIDKMVYQLYELTDEEIKIIEGKK